MKTIEIKHKTALRKKIKERVEATGELDTVWINEEGEWAFLSEGTLYDDHKKISVKQIAEQCHGEELDKAITIGLKKAEKDLYKFFKTKEDFWSGKGDLEDYHVYTPNNKKRVSSPDLKVDTKVLVWDMRGDAKKERYFKGFDKNGDIECFKGGATSWSSRGAFSSWENWELAE